MEEKLKEMLDSIAGVGSANALSLATIQHWLSEYIALHHEEVLKFPENSREPHFDLLMNDADLNHDAVFILAVFDEESVSFVSGRGEASQIRKFAENDFPENPLEVINDVSARFRIVSNPVTFSLAELNTWIRDQ